MPEAAASSSAPFIVAVANQKGGVGKTTTAMNLGAALGEMDQRVLIVDLDPQGNATTGFGIQAASREITIHEVLEDPGKLPQAIMPLEVRGVSLIASSDKLSSAAIEMASARDRLQFLSRAISPEALPAGSFDYVLIDCPPSLNLLTLNAMVAAHSVLVPLQAEYFALEGLSQLILTIRKIRESANPELAIEGVVVTMVDRRANLSVQVEQDVRGHLGELVYDSVIPRNVRLSEAPSHGLPVTLHDRNSLGSRAYAEFAGEFLRRNRKGK